ncbi:DUF2000 family protein [Marivibrio halodurans]|uniref:DUF2000 family protein n=1 Tax=Marivibrio halodurans TaxID=2039722 RepID=A0A8J7S923_9PROT|nr:DUF2000 family protein [Marivibrio halodurans]MBP5859104.1 DUF2000 family protein [Marivibrio halodurans]
MIYDTKLALAVRDDLQEWQKLNVAAFLVGGLVGQSPEIAGEPYRDGDGTVYAPLVREPIFVFSATAETLARTRRRAISRGLAPAIYTAGLFATTNDADNRAAVAAVGAETLDLVGVAVHGERKIIDKIVNGLKRHA